MNNTAADTDEIEIRENYWKIPSEKNAFDTWIEGRPTEEERQKTIEAALAAREQWKPNIDGWQLVEKLTRFVGSRVRIQFWDPIMFMLDDEGPFPVEADLVHVVIGTEDGFPQAYLRLKNLAEIPTPNGHAASRYINDDMGGCHLASLANVYTVTKVRR